MFCRPVVTAPAVVRRDGTVLADAWLPGLVRLGELERHLGDGVIEAIVDEGGRGGAAEAAAAAPADVVSAGHPSDARDGPDARTGRIARRWPAWRGCSRTSRSPWNGTVPTEKVVTDWRVLVPADVMEDLFWQAAGPLIGDGEPSAVLLAGMMVLAADGMLVNLADTPGEPGHVRLDRDRGMIPPRSRSCGIVALAARACRAMPGAILGSSRAGEQTLLKRLARRRPELFACRATCFDRNFPGHELISAILDAGGHVVARVSATVALPLEPRGGWLPDGSRMTWLNAPSGNKQDRLPVRAAEHNVILPCGDGKEVSETCTVITTLLDHEAAPVGPGSGHISHQVERVGDHVRGGQDDDHGRREPHLRPRPALRVPAVGGSSRKPGPGSPGPSSSAPARPPRCAASTPPPVPCAAKTPPRSPPTRNPSPPPVIT